MISGTSRSKFMMSTENNVLNANNPAAAPRFAAGGTPFSPQFMPFNSPFLAQCSNSTVFSCTASTGRADICELQGVGAGQYFVSPGIF